MTVLCRVELSNVLNVLLFADIIPKQLFPSINLNFRFLYLTSKFTNLRNQSGNY